MIEEQLVTIIEEVAEEKDIMYNTELIESQILDSLGIAILMARIESDFGIEIEPEDIVPENFNNINTIASLIKKYK